MRYFILILLLIFSLKPGAQEKPPTKAELDKMMNSPEVKKAMQQAGINLEDLNKIESDVSFGKLPGLNTKDLAIVSSTTLSGESLSPYLSDIKEKVFQSLTTAHKQKIRQVKDSVKNNPGALNKAAVMAWYSH